MMSIHPDLLGDLNDLARDILEEKAKDINMARQVMQSFIDTNNINANTYSRTSNENENSQQQKYEKERTEKEYQEQKNTKKQSNDKDYQEVNRDKHKGKKLNNIVKFIYGLWGFIIILGYFLLKIYGYKVNDLGQIVVICFLTFPIIILVIMKNKEYKNSNKVRARNTVMKFIYGMWFLTSILVYPLLKVSGYAVNDLGRIVYISFLVVPIIVFVLIKIIKHQ